MNFYISLFKNSKIKSVAHYGEAGAKAAGRSKGSVMTIVFELDGQEFMALNGGPHFKFTPAISLMAYCQTQAQVDEYWNKLSQGGATHPCGWLTDQFGVSWQIVPSVVAGMMQETQQEKSEKVMEAILQMEKIDIEKLRVAYESV